MLHFQNPPPRDNLFSLAPSGVNQSGKQRATYSPSPSRRSNINRVLNCLPKPFVKTECAIGAETKHVPIGFGYQHREAAGSAFG